MNDTTALGQEVASQTHQRRAIVAAVVGNALECYGFVNCYVLKVGRKQALFLTIRPMGLGTANIGLASAYASIG